MYEVKVMMEMTIKEFMEVQRGNLSYKEIRAERLRNDFFDKAENVATYIVNSPSIKTVAVLLLTISLITLEASAGTNFDAIDKVGALFLTIIRKFGYWVCLIMSFINIIKSLGEGERSLKGVTSGSMKYIVAFIMFYLLPIFFDTIRDAFGGN